MIFLKSIHHGDYFYYLKHDIFSEKKHILYHSCKNGFALPLVLWSITLLIGLLLIVINITQNSLDQEMALEYSFKSYQKALSGISVALSQNLINGSIITEKNCSDESGYTVHVSNDSGLINPKILLASTPDHRDVLKTLFIKWGVDLLSAESIADALYDWQSSISLRSLHGAKSSEYEKIGDHGLPPPLPFTSLDEMEYIMGFKKVIKILPQWKNFFTIYSLGKINILVSPKPVLVDFFSFSSQDADHFIQFIKNNESHIISIQQIIDLLGITGKTNLMLQQFADISGNIQHIDSEGFFHGIVRKITLIRNMNLFDSQGNIKILDWSEE